MDSDVYFTHDLWFACYLRSHDVSIAGLIREEKGRVNFKFKGKEKCEKMFNDYLNGGVIDIGKFKGAYNALKDFIHDG